MSIVRPREALRPMRGPVIPKDLSTQRHLKSTRVYLDHQPMQLAISLPRALYHTPRLSGSVPCCFITKTLVRPTTNIRGTQ